MNFLVNCVGAEQIMYNCVSRNSLVSEDKFINRVRFPPLTIVDHAYKLSPVNGRFIVCRILTQCKYAFIGASMNSCSRWNLPRFAINWFRLAMSLYECVLIRARGGFIWERVRTEYTYVFIWARDESIYGEFPLWWLPATGLSICRLVLVWMLECPSIMFVDERFGSIRIRVGSNSDIDGQFFVCRNYLVQRP